MSILSTDRVQLAKEVLFKMLDAFGMPSDLDAAAMQAVKCARTLCAADNLSLPLDIDGAVAPLEADEPRAKPPRKPRKARVVEVTVDETLSPEAAETLKALREHGPCGPARIAGVLGATTGAIGQRLYALEKRGLIQKTERGIYLA